jgi:hypothetical protein
VFKCDIKVKVVLSFWYLELLFNAFASVLESKKLPKKHCQTWPLVHIYFLISSTHVLLKFIFILLTKV